MKTLIAPTEDFIKLERTELDADVSAGSNVALTLLSNDGLSQNDFIVVGREGSEKAELQQINAAVVAGTTVQVATLKFAHKKGDPVTRYRYNQRKFYGATSATGTYTELTTDGSPKTIQVDDPQGTILEYTGSEGYTHFKATYYNATSIDETSIADSDAVEADESKRYTSLYNIRVQAGLTNNPFITDGRIERKRKQAENEINSMIASRYTLPLAEVPELLGTICDLLAAGYVDFEEFGPDGEGKKWLGEARGMLKSLQDGRQRLIGSDGTELSPTSKSNRLRGYPDNDGVGRADTPERHFTVNKRF
jgi:phage gp36-like protein